MNVYDKYDPVLGIEVHIELNTETKMFCGCKNKFEKSPNKNVCPVCLGFPGALPVINKKAIESAVKLGLALNCKIEKKSFMARKNYFYPDLSKNYQISQSTNPIVYDGFLEIPYIDDLLFTVPIERAHMEEDAAKNTHINGSEGRLEGASNVLIDYNRGGVPLIEIVTFPILGSGQNAGLVAKNYVKTIHELVTSLGISDAKMEEGSLRADINVSLRKKAQNSDLQNKIPFGTRTETKNVNSFKTIEKAVDYEIERQSEILDNGGKITQETRHFQNNQTVSGRAKSDSDDYRYFPEPDLVIYSPSNELIDKLKKEVPESNVKKKKKLQKEWGFSDLEMRDVVNLNILNLIEQTVEQGVSAKAAKKWWEIIIGGDYKNIQLNDVVIIEKLILTQKINNKIGKKIIDYLGKGEKDVLNIIKKYSLEIDNNSNDLENIIVKVLKQDNDVLNKLKQNNMKVIGVVIGKVMKETNGKADASQIPQIVSKVVKNLM
jgi:aspartyl-tRNA(Asn)/glutamyl-tRNA(Gln) amidotransferase subunit B